MFGIFDYLLLLPADWERDGERERWGEGGGTAVSPWYATRKKRSSLGLVTDIWSALDRSSAEKESFRGIFERCCGKGIASVIFFWCY